MSSGRMFPAFVLRRGFRNRGLPNPFRLHPPINVAASSFAFQNHIPRPAGRDRPKGHRPRTYARVGGPGKSGCSVEAEVVEVLAEEVGVRRNK